MLRVVLLSEIERDIRNAGRIKGAGRAEIFCKVEDTSQPAIRWLRGGKKLEAASFPTDKTEDDSQLVT
jgi:hypothetical protein